jgi:hypothetical protein
VDVEKLVSERDSVNNVGSLTFPTVSAGIMSTAREILESLRERKEIQMFDWNQKMLQKTAVFLSPLDYPAWVRSRWGGSWASSSCKCLVAEKLPDTETCKFIFCSPPPTIMECPACVWLKTGCSCSGLGKCIPPGVDPARGEQCSFSRDPKPD